MFGCLCLCDSVNRVRDPDLYYVICEFPAPSVLCDLAVFIALGFVELRQRIVLD